MICKMCSYNGEVETIINGPHISAYCKGCGVFLKHVPKNILNDDFVLYFGKYKDRTVKSLIEGTKEEYNYLVWLRDNAKNLKPNQIEILKKLTK